MIDYNSIIGKRVSVIVDRPLGSRHPDYTNMIYPVNYGYISDVIGGDGEEQDAYILGINVPIQNFLGKVIAVYHRFDDNEDKWIVAESDVFSDDEILKAINFQEKYFKGRLYR